LKILGAGFEVVVGQEHAAAEILGVGFGIVLEVNPGKTCPGRLAENVKPTIFGPGESPPLPRRTQRENRRHGEPAREVGQGKGAKEVGSDFHGIGALVPGLSG
jgi:hypothetical protein